MNNQQSNCLNQIGEAAGAVWEFLAKSEPVSITRITKSINASRDITLQAIGWLAREGKLAIYETKRGKLVTLANAAEQHDAEQRSAAA